MNTENHSYKVPRAHQNWLTKAEAAEYLAVSQKTVDRLAARGILPRRVIKGTSILRYRRSDLDDLLSR